MFHITPTPLSWVQWTLILGIPVLIAILWTAWLFFRIYKISYGSSEITKKETLINLIISIMIAVIVIISWTLAGMSKYYNYQHSYSYISKAKTMNQEYDSNDTKRELVVRNINGRTIYHYVGYFNFNRNGQGFNLVNSKTHKKVSIKLGNNDNLTVIDK